jgi:paraquat-inducible protein B
MTEGVEKEMPEKIGDNSAAADVPADVTTDLPVALAARRWQWASWVIWLIPILAVITTTLIIVHTTLERGDTITIEFKSAEGLDAGKTKIKYKDVDIGDVQTISLSPDRQKVIVTAQLTKGSSNLMRDDTAFWVVRPRIGAGGISGLGTLLSGAYIGVDVGKAEKRRDDFIGLDAPPPILNGQPGSTFVLKTEHIGSLNIGAPVYFRHIQVGQVISYELDMKGPGVSLKIFVNAPHDQYVMRNSLFWHASGVEVSMDASGFKVQTESVATLVAGGLSFDTPLNATPGLAQSAPAPMNTEFTLFPNRQKALQRPDLEVRKLRMYFKESIRGLLPGAPVDFRGIVIGDVQSVNLDYDVKTKRYRFPVDVNLYPQRLHSLGSDEKDSDQLMQRLLSQGLRAQLKTGNLLTGSLYVGLDFFPDAEKQKIDFKQNPIIMETVPGALDELQGSLVSIAKKLNQLPLAEISQDLRLAMTELRTALKSTEKLVARLDQTIEGIAPQAGATIEQARKTLAEMERTLSPENPLQQDARNSLREVQRAAESLRHLAETLERHPESLLRGKQEDKP